MKENDDCKWLLESSREEVMAAKGSAEKIMRIGSVSVTSGAVLYRTDVLAVLQRQITMNLSQGVLLSSQNVPSHAGHSGAALYGQDTEKKVRERVMGRKAGPVVKWRKRGLSEVARLADRDLLRRDGDAFEVQCACSLPGSCRGVELYGEKELCD